MSHPDNSQNLPGADRLIAMTQDGPYQVLVQEPGLSCDGYAFEFDDSDSRWVASVVTLSIPPAQRLMGYEDVTGTLVRGMVEWAEPEGYGPQGLVYERFISSDAAMGELHLRYARWQAARHVRGHLKEASEHSRAVFVDLAPAVLLQGYNTLQTS